VSQPALLDINVLIALFDPDHVHHEAAHAWFGTHRFSGWATCPLTENGVVRILSNPAYSPSAERPADVARRLAVFRDSGDHVFWPDDVSICDSRIFDLGIGHRHLTDVYLLALAVSRDARLATFDRKIPAKAVRGAHAGHIVVVEA
jgi:toxin-antitoxin system PIN domain toxin